MEESNKKDELYTIRHSLAHVMAQAVKKLYPHAKLGFGPPTDIGFYYDFDFGEEAPGPQDLKKIEKTMKKIIGQKQAFERSDFDADGAINRLNESGEEPFKVENIKNLSERGVTNFSFYENGGFLDLCEGPHLEHTGQLPPKAFKLDKIAGAYWLGDEKNPMLTRIYALAFKTPQELQDFIQRRKNAEQFDHKKLGKELSIFMFSDLVGKGLPLWLPNGAVIRDEIEKYAREMEFKYGYQRVQTPNLAKEDLYLKSQHLPAYEESMFPPIQIEEENSSTKYYLKPMNCPHHHLIYHNHQLSYRNLPLRLAEYGTCYRYEQTGELSGLIRVRCMTMNDAHIYCTLDQFKDEFRSLMKMYVEFYNTFKLTEYSLRLSKRSEENADKFKGDLSMWQKAEELLTEIMDELELPYTLGEGEAAFYGPKIDVQFKNLMGREETVSTIQVDFLSSENFDLNYVDADGEDKRPVIIHRAPLSTHERFISFLLEYYGGAFPLWCAPIQVAIIPVADECLEFSQKLAKTMKDKFMRVEIDDSSNSFNKKIRMNTVRKIPILLIIGKKEVEADEVTVRKYGVREQATISTDQFLKEMQNEIDERVMPREPMGSII